MHLSRVLSPVQLALTPSPLAVLVSIFGVVGEEMDCGTELILDTVAVEIIGFFGATKGVRSRRKSAGARHALDLEVEGEWCSAVPLVVRLAFSTSFFHFLTISFAASDTRLSACDRNFPTARPALLSCGGIRRGQLGVGLERRRWMAHPKNSFIYVWLFL